MLSIGSRLQRLRGIRRDCKSRVYHDYYSLNDNDPLGEVGWLLGWTGNSTSPQYAHNTFGYYYIHIAATSWRPLPQLGARLRQRARLAAAKLGQPSGAPSILR